jgi:hypothetical protein
MIESVPGIRKAAPTPCRPLARISWVLVYEPDEEDLLPSVAVAGDPAGQQQRREREDVAVDDPLDLADARGELPGDRRDRDVDDGVVEHRHREREAHREQDGDLLAGVVPAEPEHRHGPAPPIDRSGARDEAPRGRHASTRQRRRLFRIRSACGRAGSTTG